MIVEDEQIRESERRLRKAIWTPHKGDKFKRGSVIYTVSTEPRKATKEEESVWKKLGYIELEREKEFQSL